MHNQKAGGYFPRDGYNLPPPGEVLPPGSRRCMQNGEVFALLLTLIVAIASSLFFYVEAFRSGMNAKKWAISGFFLGPFILPMFSISQHVTFRKATGFGNSYLRA